MNTVAEDVNSAAQMKTMKARLKATWMSGDYDLFSRFMQKDSEVFFRRLGLGSGSRMLDVGCGSGQLALIAARKGVTATGCDIATNWLSAARQRARTEELPVTFDEGDAEMLPYPDGRFDAVVSVFGAMFAPRPGMVAAELTRVCRPGGMIAMANWTPAGFVGQLFKAIARHIAPSGMPSPVLWGDEETVRHRLNAGIAAVQLTRRIFHLDYPFAPGAVVDFYRAVYGPMARAFDSLDAQAQEQLRTELEGLWSRNNLVTDGTTRVDAEYLEVIATRS